MIICATSLVQFTSSNLNCNLDEVSLDNRIVHIVHFLWHNYEK